MEPVVRSLILKGFRSLAEVRIDFGNPTFLVGQNGSGKSNIGDALGFISEAMTSPLREVVGALGLLLAVFQISKPSLIFIDEPEASIHPGAAGAVLDTLRYAASTMQVVVSTQSPEILDAKWIEDRNLRSVVWREGATRVEEIPENARRALQTHLMGAGELLRSEALEPSPTLQKVITPRLELFEAIKW